MVTARRALAGVAILGLVVALVVIQQTRGDDPAVDLVDGALPPADDAGTAQQPAPALPATDRTPSPASTTGDEASRACAQILDDAAAFAEMEGNAANPIRASEWSDDRVRAEVEDLQRRVAGSTDPELVLTAFAMDDVPDEASDDPPDYAQLLELGLRAASSESPLVAWQALRACVGAEEYCPFPHLEQHLLEIDRDNAEAWALAATLRYQRGDVAGALAAMQGAARAPASTMYWSETIIAIERSLAAHTSLPSLVRLGLAHGVAAATFLPTQSGMCRAESAASRAWAEACLALGTLRTETTNTLLERGLGYSMREQALTALGDLEAAAEVAEEYQLFSDERVAGGIDLAVARGRLQGALISDAEKWQSFIGAMQEFGEMEGIRQFMRQELPTLMERAGLLARDGARECAAQLFVPPTAVATVSATFRDYPVEEYPIQVGDQLQILVRGQGPRSTWRRVGPDGTITMSRVPGIAVAGKTTRQLESEIATRLAERFPNPPLPEVSVYLIAPRSPEELQLEFDDALREAAESRDEPR